MAFEPLAQCRHVEGVGACEHEAVASRGIVEGQLLRDGTALRVAEHRGRIDVQVVEQARQVSMRAASPNTAAEGPDSARGRAGRERSRDVGSRDAR